MGRGGANGGEWGNGRMSIGFVLLAGRATLDIFADVRSEAWPPEFGSDKFGRFSSIQGGQLFCDHDSIGGWCDEVVCC